MKSQLDICLEAGYVYEHPMVFVVSISRSKALEIYSKGKTVLISDGKKYYEIRKGTVIQDWEGVLFSIVV